MIKKLWTPVKQALLFVLLSGCLPVFAVEKESITVMWCNDSGTVVQKKSEMSPVAAAQLFGLPARKKDEVLVRCSRDNRPDEYEYRWSIEPKSYLKTHCCSPRKVNKSASEAKKTAPVSTQTLSAATRPLSSFPQCKTKLMTKQAETLDTLRLSDTLEPNTAVVIRNPDQNENINLLSKVEANEARFVVPVIPSINTKKDVAVLALGAKPCRLGTLKYSPLKPTPNAFKELLEVQVELLTLFIELHGSSIEEVRSNPKKVPAGAVPYAILYDVITDRNNPESLYRLYDDQVKNNKTDVEILDAVVTKSGLKEILQNMVKKLKAIPIPPSDPPSQAAYQGGASALLSAFKSRGSTRPPLLVMPSALFLAGGNRWDNRMQTKGGLCVSVSSAAQLGSLLAYQKTAASVADGGRIGKRAMDDLGLWLAPASAAFPVLTVLDKALAVSGIALDFANSLLPKSISNLRFDVRAKVFNEDHDVTEIYTNLKLDAKSGTFKLSQAVMATINAGLTAGGGKYSNPLGVISNICGRYNNCGADDIKNQPSLGPCEYKNVKLPYDFIIASTPDQVVVANNKGEFKVNKAGDGYLMIGNRASRFAGHVAQNAMPLRVNPIEVIISPNVTIVKEKEAQNFTIDVQNAYDTSVTWEVTSRDGFTQSGDSKTIKFTAPEIREDKCRVPFTIKATSTSRRGIRAKGVPERSDTLTFFVKQDDDEHEACNEIEIQPIPGCLEKGQSHQFGVIGAGEKIALHPAVTWSASVGSISNGHYTAPKNTRADSVTIKAKTINKPYVSFETKVALGCTCMYDFTSGFGNLKGTKVGISKNIEAGDLVIGTGGMFDFITGETIRSDAFFEALKKNPDLTPKEVEQQVSSGFADLVGSMMAPKVILPPLSIKLDPGYRQVDVFSYERNGETFYAQDGISLTLSSEHKDLLIGEIKGTLADANKENISKFTFKFRAAKGGGAICPGLGN